MAKYLVIFILLTGTISNAQIDTVDYKLSRIDGSSLHLQVTSDEPNNLPDLSFTGGLAIGSQPLNLIDIQFAFQARYIFKNYGFIDARFNLPTFPKFDDQYNALDGYSNLRTTNNFNLFDNIDIVLGYNFKDTSYFAYQKLLIRLPNSGKHHRIKRRTLVQYTTKHLIGARLGYYHHQGIINNLFLDEEQLIADNGDYIDVGGPNSVINQNGADVYHTNFSAHSIFIGADVKTFRKLKLKVDGDTMQHSLFYNFFIDLMIAPIINVEDMIVRDFDTGEKTAYNVAHDGVGGFNKMPFGGRIGIEVSKYYDKHDGLTLQAEMGVRPGFSNINNPDAFLGPYFYIQTKLMYTLGFKIGKK